MSWPIILCSVTYFGEPARSQHDHKPPPFTRDELSMNKMEATQPLCDQVSTALWQLERELLMDVCRRLKCSGLDSGEPRSRTKRTLIRMAEDEDQVEQCYKDIATYIRRRSKGDSQSEEEPPSKEFVPNIEPDDNPARISPRRMKNTPPRTRKEPAQTLQEVTLRREFKICGQIGEHGQKDRLSYLSLIRQIENGSEKGHAEAEIVEAVIRAISPGMPLRDMLEIKRGLTLSKLLTILKGHYKVDSPTELYHQLLNLSQEPKETALNFGFRAIKLKEKLLWKVSNEETDELYSRATIQHKFLRSIETGLLSDSIKYQLLPLLSDLSVTDGDLIETLNEASKLENERLEKRKRSTAAKIPKVQEFQTECQAAQTSVQTPLKLPESSPLVAVKTVKGKETKADTQQMIEELRKEMQQMFMTAMENSPCTMTPRQREKGCKKCKKERKGDNCMRCFKCGREGHYSCGCRFPSVTDSSELESVKGVSPHSFGQLCVFIIYF
ncbi:uncharacterized protein LOC129187699 [Dunckerocampus dactyliophorus]|uniref:uncharacterized protein LOC129187699 n=1 Tax=Dunckerocampus dactyliophorus TaxID=161453 RepID=UPI0024060E84|nr:uncharacterized protein LOC129187699 [Dunckerocampus dactyliophorus]